MKEIMYDHNSVLIVSALFICMLLAMEIGFRSGRRRQAYATEAITQANAVLAAMLGLLALLLAFTFSAALQLYEDRSHTVVAEANAIATTYLRAHLLPKGMPMKCRRCSANTWTFAFRMVVSMLRNPNCTNHCCIRRN